MNVGKKKDGISKVDNLLIQDFQWTSDNTDSLHLLILRFSLYVTINKRPQLPTSLSWCGYKASSTWWRVKSQSGDVVANSLHKFYEEIAQLPCHWITAYALKIPGGESCAEGTRGKCSAEGRKWSPGEWEMLSTASGAGLAPVHICNKPHPALTLWSLPLSESARVHPLEANQSVCELESLWPAQTPARAGCGVPLQEQRWPASAMAWPWHPSGCTEQALALFVGSGFLGPSLLLQDLCRLFAIQSALRHSCLEHITNLRDLLRVKNLMCEACKPPQTTLVLLWERCEDDGGIWATGYHLGFKSVTVDFPGGPMVKNSPANAGTGVRSLLWEDSTCLRATKSTRHNYWAQALEPLFWTKPLQWEAHIPQLESSPCSLQLEKAPKQQQRPRAGKNK